MVRKRRSWWIPAATLALWLIAGLTLVPSLIERVYESGMLPVLSRRPVDFFLAEWRSMVWFGAAAGLAAFVFIRATRDAGASRRIVPSARPSDLGAIRALVAGTLLISTLWEDLASTAAIPREVMNPLGVMQLLALIPKYEVLAASEHALSVFEWLTAFVLFLAAIGWKTRISVPTGAILYLILGGWLRQYAWFYHTGLLGIYLLAVLAFLPAGHGFSVDRLLRRRRGKSVTPDRPSRRFGWARYAVWTTLALPYVAAGFSKLRNGGLYWWEASNFKFILFQSTLRPMEFDFDISLALASAPDWFVEALALSAVLGEILYGLVLVSRWGRWIMPATMLLMHIGILALQNILFFDLILLQLIFYNYRPLLIRFSRRSSVFRRIVRGATVSADVGRPVVSSRRAPRGRKLTGAVTVLLTICWVFRIEFYPLTGMQMFSGKRSEPVVYEKPLAHLHSGELVRAPIEKSIGAMSDGRFRRVLQMAFDAETEHVSRAFMQSVANRWNRQVDEPERIRHIEIQRWKWYFLAEPNNPNYGRLEDRVIYSVAADEGF